MAGPDKPATNVVQGVCGREVVELLNCAASDKCDEGECVRWPTMHVFSGALCWEPSELLDLGRAPQEHRCITTRRLAAALRECAKKHHIKNFTAQVNAREGETGKPGA